MVELNVAVSQRAAVAAGTTLLALVAFTSFWMFQKKKSIKAPSKWKPIGKVKQLLIYPIKSGKAIELSKAECTESGLKETKLNGTFALQDRYFLIYHEVNYKFLTARQDSSTLLLSASAQDKNTIILNHPSAGSQIRFEVPDENDKKKLTKCRIHCGEWVEALDCGDGVAVWLSKLFLGKESGLRLGYYDETRRSLQRIVSKGPFKDQVSVYSGMHESNLGAYADLASCMVVTKASLDDLNSKLEPENKADVKQFRPNIVVEGLDASPYEEDGWGWMKIGENVIMTGFKPCTRCRMVTLDPNNGIANSKLEPLLTLKSYRLVTDPAKRKIECESPVFGRYFGIFKTGEINVNDTIYIPSE